MPSRAWPERLRDPPRRYPHMNGQGATSVRRRAQAEDAQGQGDPASEARAGHTGLPEDREGQEALDGPASRLIQQLAEHLVAPAPVVVAPRVLVQVALKPLVRDAVVDAPERVLQKP